jgi:hypothetical protein
VLVPYRIWRGRIRTLSGLETSRRHCLDLSQVRKDLRSLHRRQPPAAEWTDLQTRGSMAGGNKGAAAKAAAEK